MLSPSIPIALPLAVAAALGPLHRRIPCWLSSTIAIVASVLVAYSAIDIITETRFDPSVYSLGGRPPSQGPSLGLFLVLDNAGGILVLIASLLAIAALVFSICYLGKVASLYQALTLLFLAAASGFSLTGDLMNLFVFFEIMGLAAFALCRVKPEVGGGSEPGARNLIAAHAVASLSLLAGIGLLFARTGSLNMALIGRTLAGQPDALVTWAFAFIACGLFVQALIVPFHFWFADAVAMAPAPVSALFAGIMPQIGLYGVVRIYWAVFSGALGVHENELRNLLAAFGAATALTGAVMCFAERHLKRLLGFAVVSHMGILLLAVALLTPEALAGACIYVMGVSVLFGGLFLGAGILLHRTATLDEIELTARPRHLRWTGGLFFLGAAGLAGLPPFGTFWGEMMLDGSALHLGYFWIPWVAFASAVITAGAIFRFAGRAFFRWGPPVEEFAETAAGPPEHVSKPHHHTPASMYAPAAFLLLLGVLAGLAPRLTGAAEAAAIHMQDRVAYAQRVLDLLTPYPPTVHEQPALAGDLLRGISAVFLAALLAALTLGSASSRRIVGESPFAQAVVAGLRRAHGGLTRAYVTWMVAGVVVFGSAAFLLLQ